jgi:hypothetical protein
MNPIKQISYKAFDDRVEDGNTVEYVTTDINSIKNIFNKVKKIDTHFVGIRFGEDGLNVMCAGSNGLGLHIIFAPASGWYFYREPKFFSVSKQELCNFTSSMQKQGKNSKATFLFAGKEGSNDLSLQYFPRPDITVTKELSNIASDITDNIMEGTSNIVSKLDEYSCVVEIDGAMFSQMKAPGKCNLNSTVKIFWSPTDDNLTFSKVSRDSNSDCVTVARRIKGCDETIVRETNSVAMTVISSMLGARSESVRVYLHPEYNLMFEFDMNSALFRCIYTPVLQ